MSHRRRTLPSPLSPFSFWQVNELKVYDIYHKTREGVGRFCCCWALGVQVEANCEWISCVPACFVNLIWEGLGLYIQYTHGPFH